MRLITRKAMPVLLSMLIVMTMCVGSQEASTFAADTPETETAARNAAKAEDTEVTGSGNNTAKLTEPAAELPASDLAFNGSYVSQNYNRRYVSRVDQGAFAAPVTYARSNAAYTREAGDRLFEGPAQSNIIAAMNYYTLIYDVDPDSRYYVALPDVNMGTDRFSPYAIDVVYNNNANELLEDVFFDEATSILYISKKYFTDPAPEAELFDDTSTVAIQVSYQMPEAYTAEKLPDYGKRLPLVAFTSGSEKKYVYKDVRVNNIFDVTTLLPCLVEDPSLYTAEDFVITLNGTYAPLSAKAGQYSYDPESGEIVINDSAATMSAITVMIDEKGLSDKARAAAKNAFGDLYVHAADTLEHEDMKALRYKNKYIRIQDDDSGNLYNSIYLGWRGYYDNGDVSGDSIKYNTNTQKLIAGCGDFFENSITYLHAASSKSAAWAMVSYAVGGDATKETTAEDVVSGRNTDREIPKRDDVSKYGGVSGKKTFYEWMTYYRKHLLNYTKPGSENGSSNTYWDNGGKQLQFQNSAGQDNGAVTFAFQFPENITGAPNFVDDAHRVKGKNTDKVDLTITADGIDLKRKDLWLAGWCRHFYDGDKGQNKSKTVYVSCIGKGVEAKTNRKYVVLSFASDGAFSYTKSNGKLGWQTGGAVYKLYVGKVTPRKGKFQIYKEPEKENIDPKGSYSMAGAVFKVYDDDGQVVATMPVKTYNESGKRWETDIVELEEGDYTVKETTAPSNGKWELDQSKYKVSIDADKYQEKPYVKHMKEAEKDTSGYLRIRKIPEAGTDEADIHPTGDYSMAGATYTVTDKSTGKSVAGSPFAIKWQKDPESEGNVWITDLIHLDYGTYTITEKKAPLCGRWERDKAAKEVTINSAHTANARIFKHTEHRIDPGLLKIEKVPEPEAAELDIGPGGNFSMKGASYSVTDKETGELIGTYPVEWEQNEHKWSTDEIELEYGTYIVKEARKPANGTWILDSAWSREVSITSENVQNVKTEIHTEQVERGSLKIRKTPKDPPAGFTVDGTCYSLSNALYEVFNHAGRKVGELRTDEKGESPLLDNLIPGPYTVKEKESSAGFNVQIPEDQTVNVQPKDTKIFESQEPPQFGYIRFDKVAGYAFDTQGKTVPEEGAKFVIWNCTVTKTKEEAKAKGPLYYQEIITPDGVVQTEKLALGTYIVEQEDVGKYRDFIRPMKPVTVTLVPDKWIDLSGHVAEQADELTAAEVKNDHPSRVALTLQKTSDDHEMGHFGISAFRRETKATFKVESVDTEGTDDDEALTVSGYQEEVTTDAEGKVRLMGPEKDGFVPTGKYRITETVVTPGFYNNPETSVRYILVDTSGRVKAVEEIEFDDAGITSFQAEEGKQDFDDTREYQLTWTKKDTPQYTRLKINKVRHFINEFGNPETKPQPGVEFVLYAEGDILSYDGDGKHVYYKDGDPIQGMLIDPDTGARTYYLDGKKLEDPTQEQREQVRILTDSQGKWDCGQIRYPLTNQGYPVGAGSKYMMKEMYVWETGDHISFTDDQMERMREAWKANGFRTDQPLEEAGGMTFEKILHFGIDIVTKEVREQNGGTLHTSYSSAGNYIEERGDTKAYPTYKFIANRIGKYIASQEGDQEITDENGEQVAHLERRQAILSPSEAADLKAPTQHIGPVEANKPFTEFTFAFVNEQIPSIGTTASLENHRKKIPTNGKVAFLDTVEYRNLFPGISYKLEARLIDKVTNQEIKQESGAPLRATKTFTPASNKGRIVVEFPEVDASLLPGDTVVFEKLYETGTEVAVHEDLDDKGQTVEHAPVISTTATAGSMKEVPADGTVTITDTVAYKGLRPGKEYILKGVLMNRQTGKPLQVKGKKVTTERAFVADVSGKTQMDFIFDASGLHDKAIVVFEQVWSKEDAGKDSVGGEPIASHEDLGSASQTVLLTEVEKPEKPSRVVHNKVVHKTERTKTVKKDDENEPDSHGTKKKPRHSAEGVDTGDTTDLLFFFLIATMAAAATTLLALWKRIREVRHDR